MTSDLPPAYHSLHTSTADLPTAEESIQNSVDDSELLFNGTFEDKNTRVGFLQKVLTINLLQVFTIAVVTGSFALYGRPYYWYYRGYGPLIHLIVLSILAFIAITGLLFYCKKARRENPFRYVFLVLHPLNFAFAVTFLLWTADFLGEFAVAWLNYLGAMLAVILYSVFCLQTKLEFAAKHAIFIAGFVQIIIYALTVPFIYVNAFATLYVSLALTLIYIYIFWDLEYMTSKKYWHDITPDQFVDGALNLQIDYYYMFIKLIMPPMCNALEGLN